MKFKLLAAVLATEVINLKAGLFGGKPFASFDEEALEKIENALEEKDTTALTAENEALKNEAQNTVNALTEALSLNDISLGVEATVVDQIKALGQKCKEYGEKKNVHTTLTNNGKEPDLDEGLIEGYIDPNAEHNKLLNSI